MDEAALAAIKARSEAASPGPWKHCGCGKCGQVQWDSAQNISMAPVATTSIDWSEGGYDNWLHEAQQANATFIAHAREDVPALVAEVERLRQALADYGGHNEWCSGQYGPSYRCRCGWRDEARALGIGVDKEDAV